MAGRTGGMLGCCAQGRVRGREGGLLRTPNRRLACVLWALLPATHEGVALQAAAAQLPPSLGVAPRADPQRMRRVQLPLLAGARGWWPHL